MKGLFTLTGHVSYKHRVGEGTGTVIFKFTVSDENGNDLLDQHFYITVLGKLFKCCRNRYTIFYVCQIIKSVDFELRCPPSLSV